MALYTIRRKGNGGGAAGHLRPGDADAAGTGIFDALTWLRATVLQYIPIDKGTAFGRPVTHRGGEQMRKLCAVAVPLGGLVLLIIVMRLLVGTDNDNVCATISRTIDIPPIKKITDFLFRCS